MTDRYNALTVVLETDIRSDEATATLMAITQIKGVLSVTPHVSEISDVIAENRSRQKLIAQIWEVLYPAKNPS